MTKLIVEPTARAAWHRLITDAEVRCSQPLGENNESYLVFLLMRYLTRPDLVRAVLALNFLRASRSQGRLREERMQAVGDQCLIYAGLFPQRAQRKRVRLGYFIDMGRSAYDSLAATSGRGSAQLFHGLAEAFVPLTDVLHALRGDPDAPLFEPLAAAERYAETGSAAALQELEKLTSGLPVANSSERLQ